MGHGLVYFVTYDNVAWRATLPVIKIGATTDLPKRLSSLSVSSPIKLLVAGTIAAKDPYPLEKSLHRAFQRDRLNGEWFKLNSKMLDAIRLHPIVDDRFNELFDFTEHSPDAKDLEIAALRDEIKRLKGLVEPGGCVFDSNKREWVQHTKPPNRSRRSWRGMFACNP